MTFFNKKEDVIDLVLTKLGREKLSEGKFKPTYYEFYDDDIIYDKRWAGGSINSTNHEEKQNRIVERIKENISLRTQNNWAQSKITKGTTPKAPPMFKPLGHSSQFDAYKPAWDIKVMEGEISGSVTFVPLEFSSSAAVTTVGAFSQEKVPQIDLVCEYTPTYFNRDETPEKHEIWLHKSSDDILIDLSEINTTDTEDNFSIEVYKYISEDGKGIVDATPLFFSEDDFGSQFVEYYFDISVDKDAEEEVEIKYIDEILEKTFEVDECVSALQATCAKDKIDQLKQQLSAMQNAVVNLKAGGVNSCAQLAKDFIELSCNEMSNEWWGVSWNNFLGGQHKQLKCSQDPFNAAFEYKCKGKGKVTSGNSCDSNQDCVVGSSCKNNKCT